MLINYLTKNSSNKAGISLIEQIFFSLMVSADQAIYNLDILNCSDNSVYETLLIVLPN